MPQNQACDGCRNGDAFPVDFTMAFQPIVDLSTSRIWGYEALVRGMDGEGAGAVLAAVTPENRYRFDQACRVKAIELAGRNMPENSAAKLSINFMPNAVYEPAACIRASLAAAARANFDPKRLMFEFTENERFADVGHVENIVSSYRRMGFTTALDDFGAGYAGLGLLARFQPDLIKIDMELVRGVDSSGARQAIVSGLVGIANVLNIEVLAEGVETEQELQALRGIGIRLYQGYLFARPDIERFQIEAEINHLWRTRSNPREIQQAVGSVMACAIPRYACAGPGSHCSYSPRPVRPIKPAPTYSQCSDRLTVRAASTGCFGPVVPAPTASPAPQRPARVLATTDVLSAINCKASSCRPMALSQWFSRKLSS